jgi:hypothetical protein
MITSLEHRYIELFLRAVYNIHDPDEETELVYTEFNCLLEAHDYGLVDKILQRLNLEELNASLMRTFLCITEPARHRLTSYPAFFQRVDEWMVAVMGPERTERLIGCFR